MNRRSFLKGVFGVACGIPALSLLKTEDPIAILRHKRKIRYKGIDWRLDYRMNYRCDQLSGSAARGGERCISAVLLDPEYFRDDKVLRYNMDNIARRFKAKYG